MERNQGKAATMLAGQPTARQRAVQVRLTKGELRLRAGCGLWGLPWKEKLPVSNKSSSKSGLERRRQPALFPLWPLPHRKHHGPERRVALTRVIHKAPLPYNKSASSRQRNMAQMKEQSKTSEKELSNEETANLSDGEIKALVIKMLTELIELGRK